MSRQRNKSLTRIGSAVLACTGLLASSLSLAAVTITPIDATGESGGRWDQKSFNTEDNCFYLLPTPDERNLEEIVGPANILPSSESICMGGLSDPNLVSMGEVTIRLTRSVDPEENVFSWSYDGTDRPFNLSAAQYIPDNCGITDLDNEDSDLRNGTFDNGDLDPGNEVKEPMAATMTLGGTVTGNGVLSYYFMNGSDECRTLDWSLKSGPDEDNLTEAASGQITDFALGKYLAFELDGLMGGEVIRLEMTDPTNGEGCAASTDGINSVISGVFVSGTSVCTDEPLTITRTLGYWKNHPTVIDGTCEDCGAIGSLLPLNFCGDAITEACDAVEYLQSKGGGINNFKRQGMAALLNCDAFGCSPEIAMLIAEGSAACDSGADYDFGTAGETLDAFNNSGDDLDLGFQSPSAQPHACSSLKPGQIKQMEKLLSKSSLSKKQKKKLKKLKKLKKMAKQ